MIVRATDQSQPTDPLRERVEKPHVRRMWGEERMVSPRLVSEVFGDGRLLVGISPANSRPEYYVVRVDSRFKGRLNDDDFRDLLDDDVYDAIGEEFGVAEGWATGEDSEDDDWPSLDLSVGCSWFEYEHEDGAACLTFDELATAKDLAALGLPNSALARAWLAAFVRFVWDGLDDKCKTSLCTVFLGTEGDRHLVELQRLGLVRTPKPRADPDELLWFTTDPPDDRTPLGIIVAERHGRPSLGWGPYRTGMAGLRSRPLAEGE